MHAVTHGHSQILRLAGNMRGPIAATTLCGLAVGLVALVLSEVFVGTAPAELTWLLVSIAAAITVRAGLVWLREVLAQLTAHRVKQRVRGRIYDHLLALGPGYLLRQRTGDVKTVVVDGVEALEAYFARYLPTVGVCLLGPAAILAFLATQDLMLTGVLLVFAIATPLAPRAWDALTAERGARRWEAYSTLSADYVDAMQGMTTLKAMNATTRFREELAARAQHLYDTTMRQLGIALFDTGLTTFAILAGSATAIGLGAMRVANGDLELVTLFTVLFLGRELFRPFSDLSKYWHTGFDGLSSSARITALLETTPEVGTRLVGTVPGPVSWMPVSTSRM